jgi:hypothetical protein
MNEHARICMDGANLVEAELRKANLDRITVYVIHSSPGTSGRVVIERPEDTPEGFTVLAPGGGVNDWRAVPYSSIFSRLLEATKSLPILSY